MKLYLAIHRNIYSTAVKCTGINVILMSYSFCRPDGIMYGNHNMQKQEVRIGPGDY